MIIPYSLLIISSLILLWIYAGYSVFVFMLVRTKRLMQMTLRDSGSTKFDSETTPKVSVIVPAYNEEKVIALKLMNIQALHYPKNKIETIIVCDGLTDNTRKVVEPFISEHVSLIEQEKREGKAAAISRGIEKAKGEIIIVTDANAFFEPGILQKIIPHFKNPIIGGVSGAMRQINKAKTSISSSSESYWNYEKIMRTYESEIYSVIGMSGEVSAVRRSLFISDGKIVDWYVPGSADDFQMTLYIIKKGLRVIYEPAAEVNEPAPDSKEDLLKQKIRIITQTIVSVIANRDIVLSFRYGLYGPLIFFSRKVLPLFSPFLLLIAFIASVFISFQDTRYVLIVMIETTICLIALLGFIRQLSRIGLVRMLHFFFLLNIAILIAWREFLYRRDYTIWNKIESSRNV